MYEFDKDPDWISTNESDGQVFFGYDDGDGHTDWYDSNGDLDCRTETPSEDDCGDYLEQY